MDSRSTFRRTVATLATALAFALAVLPLLAPAQAQAQDPPQPASPNASNRQALRQAIDLLQADKPDAAIKKLQGVARSTDDKASAYVAQLLAGQLVGRFTDRQKAWRDAAVVNAVVLVPDVRSYYAALGHWTDKRRFPVLIEDGWWAPMFIRAFEPGKVVRWSAPDARPGGEGAATLKRLIDDHENRLDQRDEQAPPPGLVVVDPGHPHAPAAAALALGRRQRTMRFAPDADVAYDKADEVEALNRTIMGKAAAHGLVTGQTWFGITLAGDYPAIVEGPRGKLALVDLLGRGANDLRLGVAGQLHGPTEQAIFQAMGSLFLQPRRALLLDDYARRQSHAFQAYRYGNAAAILDQWMTVAHLENAEASAAGLQRASRRGQPFDMLWINSSGGPAGFALHGGAGVPDDLPLAHPTVVYFVHSFSAARLASANTLGGRALYNGAYWYYGSVHEPGLAAFAKPTGMTHMAAAGTPLAFAARQPPGALMHRPWKLTLVGDPLFTLRKDPAKRVAEGLPEGVRTVAQQREGEPARRFRHALLLGDDRATDLAAEAVKDDDLPEGDLRSAVWLLGRAGRIDALRAGMSSKQARRDPMVSAYLGADARERFAAARRAGELANAYDALIDLLLFSGDRREMTRSVKALIAEAAKQGRDDAIVARLRERLGESPMPVPARNAARRALPKQR